MLSKFFFEKKKKTMNLARKLINFVQPKMLILSSLPPILVISFIYVRHQNSPSLFNIGGLVQDLLFHVFQVIHGLNFFHIYAPPKLSFAVQHRWTCPGSPFSCFSSHPWTQFLSPCIQTEYQWQSPNPFGCLRRCLFGCFF